MENSIEKDQEERPPAILEEKFEKIVIEGWEEKKKEPAKPKVKKAVVVEEPLKKP